MTWTEPLLRTWRRMCCTPTVLFTIQIAIYRHWGKAVPWMFRAYQGAWTFMNNMNLVHEHHELNSSCWLSSDSWTTWVHSRSWPTPSSCTSFMIFLECLCCSGTLRNSSWTVLMNVHKYSWTTPWTGLTFHEFHECLICCSVPFIK